MNPEDIQKCIHDGIAKALADQLPTAVSAAVNTAVNGKIIKLTNDVAPLVKVYNSYLSWKKGALIWIGILLAIGGFIQAAQAVYGVVSNLFVISVR
jgi:hypothetical protein